MLLLIEDGGAWRAFRVGSDCSLDGGVGAGSTGTGTLSPSGPKGPRESSTASSRCVSTRRGVRGVRGPLPAVAPDDDTRLPGTVFGFCASVAKLKTAYYFLGLQTSLPIPSAALGRFACELDRDGTSGARVSLVSMARRMRVRQFYAHLPTVNPQHPYSAVTEECWS
jgi:hypothetical protein